MVKHTWKAVAVAERDEDTPPDVRDMTRGERELFTETATSLPVDFHSWRRAFNQALANAGVNAQTAQALAGHASLTAHERYLRNADDMKRMPEAALPRLLIEKAQPDPIEDDGAEMENEKPRRISGFLGGADETRTRGLRRDRGADPVISAGWTNPDVEPGATESDGDQPEPGEPEPASREL